MIDEKPQAEFENAIERGRCMNELPDPGVRVVDVEGYAGVTLPSEGLVYALPNHVLVRLDAPLYGVRDYWYTARQLRGIEGTEENDWTDDLLGLERGDRAQIPGRDELIVLIGQAIREELAGLSVFPDEYRFGDEAEAVLEALEQVGYRIVRADRLIEVSSVSTMTGNPGTWGKREEEGAE